MLELLSLIPSALKLIEGIGAKGASDKEAEQIKKQQLNMPSEMGQAEGIARNLASSDMPGFQNAKESIDQLVPKTAKAVQETASSPVAMIDMMSKALAETDKTYNELADKNAAFHLGTMQNYQNTLENKAGMNLAIQHGNIATNKEAIAQHAQGTKDLFQGIENAGGSLLDTYAMMKKLGYEKDYLKYMGGYFGQDKTTSLAPNVPSYAPIEDPNQTDPFAYLKGLDLKKYKNLSDPNYKEDITDPNSPNSFWNI